MNSVQKKLLIIKKGFESLSSTSDSKSRALNNIEKWLSGKEFLEYVPQIEYLIETKKWDLLLDSFYQVIPFGTGGRRGIVGIGPNRINTWTVQTSAQGHAQYLLKNFPKEARSRGIVIAFDVRAYLDRGDFDNTRSNPMLKLSSKVIAEKMAEVYAGNGFNVKLFHDFTPTPELSFMVRELKAIAGVMITASHNPPEYNGIKVYTESGGSILPPYDVELINVVSNEVSKINSLDFEEAKGREIIQIITEKQHSQYIKAVKGISLNSKNRGVKILFSPLHGVSYNTVPRVLDELKFESVMDEKTGVPDSNFSYIPFRNPNPEIESSFSNLIPEAEKVNADIILTTDPDADRTGLMSREKDGWRFFTGNEIGVLLSNYMLMELRGTDRLKPTSLIVKTIVTTNLVTLLAKSYGVQIEPDLLVGFKYIAEVMDKLEVAGKADDFLLGMEESHGYLAGNYARDKDSAVAIILLAELASKLKKESKTIGEYLDEIYREHGYFLNYTTEIRLPGVEGMENISQMLTFIRSSHPDAFGDYRVGKYIDMLEGNDFLSDSDKESRNLIVINFKLFNDIHSLKVIIRPSGTEPKLKIYIEVGVKVSTKQLSSSIDEAKKVKDKLEKSIITKLYKVIGIDFPERGFLLYKQLPVKDKLKYFEIEPLLIKLNDINNKEKRRKQLEQLLSFLGSDPIMKIDDAFKVKYKKGVEEYLDL